MILRKGFSTVTVLLTAVLLAACSGSDGSDKGTCRIFLSGDDLIIENVTLDECGETFLETPGARGYEWTP